MYQRHSSVSNGSMAWRQWRNQQACRRQLAPLARSGMTAAAASAKRRHGGSSNNQALSVAISMKAALYAGAWRRKIASHQKRAAWRRRRRETCDNGVLRKYQAKMARATQRHIKIANISKHQAASASITARRVCVTTM